MRGFVIFVGLLLMLGGGAVAGAQFAPIDLSTISAFDSVPGSREFLTTNMALYAGGGAAAFGLLLVIIGAATGGKKRMREAAKPPSLATETFAPRKAKSERTPAPPAAAKPVDAPIAPPVHMPPPAASPKPAPRFEPAPVASKPAAQQPPAPPPVAPPAPKPVSPAPQPLAAAPPEPKPVISPAPQAAPAPEIAKAKPQASGQPPTSAAPVEAQAAANGAPAPDPRLINRKRVQDLVTINDAVKAFHAKNGAYPKAEGLAGANERGAAWIPGLSPEFLAEIPRDPLHSAGTQYVYASDGANYKLLAQGASLIGSGNVEVLGVRIDQTRNPTPPNAAFGFWTAPFAGV